MSRRKPLIKQLFNCIFCLLLLCSFQCFSQNVPARLVASVGHNKDILFGSFSSYENVLATIATDHKIIIWDTKTGKEINTLYYLINREDIEKNYHMLRPISIIFSPDSVHIYVNFSGLCLMFNYIKGTQEHIFFPSLINYSIDLSDDGKNIIFSDSIFSKTAYTYNIITFSMRTDPIIPVANKQVDKRKEPNNSGSKASGHKDKRFISSGATGTIVDDANGTSISLKSNQVLPVFGQVFAITGKKLLTVHNPQFLNYKYHLTDEEFMVWGKAVLAKSKYSGRPGDEPYWEKKFVEEGLKKQYKPALNVTNPSLRLWDLEKGVVTDSIGEDFISSNDNVGEKGKYFITSEYLPQNDPMSLERKAMLSDWGRDIKLDGIVDSLKNIAKVASSVLKDIYISNTLEYTAKSLLINNVSHDTFSLFAMNTEDWVIVNKAGYFMASKEGAGLLHYVKNKKIYSFDQFDLQFNRPDLLLKEIGIASDAIIELNRWSVIKRWQDMKIDTAQFNNKEENYNAPEIEIKTNLGSTNVVHNKHFPLIVNITKGEQKILTLHVWVNGTPLYCQPGKDLNGISKKNIEVNLDLNPGLNVIEVSVLNVQSVSSNRERIEVTYKPTVYAKPKLYVVALGVSNYEDPLWNKLPFAENDARDIAKLFDTLKTPFLPATVFLLTGRDVTPKRLDEIRNNLMNTNPDDAVIIFYSGHGIRTRDQRLFLGTQSMNFRNPEKNGLADEWISEMLCGIPARHRLYLIDACQSGKVNSLPISSVKAINLINENKNDEEGKFVSSKENEQTRGANELNIPKGPNEYAFDLMINRFRDLFRGNGATEITATTGYGLAYEDGIVVDGKPRSIENGVFTYCIKAALTNQQHLTISDFKAYILEMMDQIVIHKKEQRAMIRQENRMDNWSLK